MIEIIIIMAAFAVALLVTSRLMAAQNTGITVPSTTIYCGGGDPLYIYLTAENALTPGDNVYGKTSDNTRCNPCAANSFMYLGTADLNDDAVLDGNNPISHDFASGELVPIITGSCMVRKIADASNVTGGEVQEIGQSDGAECQDINARGAKYAIGRALTAATSGNAFVMRQW
jgi:hypothetical protein